MDDKTLVERLRMTGKRISVPCPDGIDGCLVNHFRIETDPLCDEAATRIEALEAALRFYARENSWKSCGVYMSGQSQPSSAEVDRGNKARKALESKP